MAVWWDGDLSRELLDGTRIEKWTGDGVITLFDGKKDGVLSNNGSKANPCLAADILGDWREEVIWRSKDNNEYSTKVAAFKVKKAAGLGLRGRAAYQDFLAD
jgi:hypothetical protein